MSGGGPPKSGTEYGIEFWEKNWNKNWGRKPRTRDSLSVYRVVGLVNREPEQGVYVLGQGQGGVEKGAQVRIPSIAPNTP